MAESMGKRFAMSAVACAIGIVFAMGAFCLPSPAWALQSSDAPFAAASVSAGVENPDFTAVKINPLDVLFDMPAGDVAAFLQSDAPAQQGDPTPGKSNADRVRAAGGSAMAVSVQSSSVSALSLQAQSSQSPAAVIKDALAKRDSSIVVGVSKTSTVNDLWDLFESALEEDGVSTHGDYLRWVYSKVSVSKSGEKATFKVEYKTTAAQEQKVVAEAQKAVNALSKSTTWNSELSKAKAIYDWICDHVDYATYNASYAKNGDGYAPIDHTAYGAIVNGKSVCQGYASLYYLMAHMAGIDTRIVAGTGYTGNGASETHAWNIVKVGSKWYALDTTWDANRFNNDQDYRYCFLAENAIRTDHIRGNSDLASAVGILNYSSKSFNNAHPMATSSYPFTSSKVNGVSYRLMGNEAIAVSFDGSSSKVSLSKSVGGLPVTAIGEDFVKESKTLQSVTVPSSVKSIHVNAFSRCAKLKTVNLSEGLEGIGRAAFFNILTLESVALPGSVKRVGAQAFDGCYAMSSVSLLGKPSSVGTRAFTSLASPSVMLVPSAAAKTALAKSVSSERTSLVQGGAHKLAYVKGSAATCSKAGQKPHYACADCGKLFVISGGALVETTAAKLKDPGGHVWGPWAVLTAATKTAPGWQWRYCSRCSEIQYKSIPKGSKAANPMVAAAKAKTLTVKYNKKKPVTIAKAKWASVSYAQGKVTYAKAKGTNAKIKVSSAGVVTIPKNMKKGTYAVKVKVTAKGNGLYKAASKAVSFKVRVK